MAVCSASTETAAQLKPCELKTAALLPTFRLVTAALPVDVDRAVREGECASLAAAVSEAVCSAGTRAQCARFLPPAPAAATPVGGRTAVKEVLGSEAGVHSARSVILVGSCARVGPLSWAAFLSLLSVRLCQAVRVFSVSGSADLKVLSPCDTMRLLQVLRCS